MNGAEALLKTWYDGAHYNDVKHYCAASRSSRRPRTARDHAA